MDETLKVIIQLVILCIPLITLPLILKTSSSILGRVSGMAEKFNSKAFEPGLSKSVGGLKTRVGERARFTAGNLYEKGLASDRAGSGALNWAQGRRRNSQAKRKARQSIIEARKKASEETVGERALEHLGAGGVYSGLGGEKIQAAIRAEQVKADKAVIENLQADWKQRGLSPTEIGTELRNAIRSGDGHKIEAAMGSLSAMGAGGQDILANEITGAGPVSGKSQEAINRGINNPSNYDGIMAGAGGIGKGSFDSSGVFQSDYLGLNTQQIIKQSAQSAGAFHAQATTDLGSTDAAVVTKARAAVDNAHRIVNDPRLSSQVDSATLAQLQTTARLKTW